jgi:hypothetical protein
MNTQTMSKFAILASFLINGLMLAGVNYLFNDHMYEHTFRASLAPQAAGARPL